MATPGSSPPASGAPCPCKAAPTARRAPGVRQRRSQRRRRQFEQPDQRLRVVDLVDQGVELGQRARLDVDALVLVRLGLGVRQPRREVDVDLLVAEAGRGVVGVQVLPVLGRLADLLGQLALGRLERLLPLDVELARGDLEQVGHADRLARLADEVDPLAVVRDHADRALVADDLARDLLPVLVAEGVLDDGEDLALVPRLARDPLEARAHTAAASSSSAKATSSMLSSASTETRSVGSWLRSVPLARFTHWNPATSSTLASEPPPVTIRRGS